MKLCQHGCGKPAVHITKSSLGSGPFKGAPVHQCATSANSCQAVKDRKVASSIAKYGTKYPWQTKEVIETRNQTNLKKYGHNSSIMNPTIQAKRKKTMIDRYGVEEPLLNDQIRTKAAAGMLAAHAADPSISAQSVATKREKYGDDLSSITSKNRKTQIANGRWVDPAKKTEWNLYKFQCRRQTAINYKKFKDIINPDNLPLGVCDYQIDHIYSIRHGFENGVDPAVIASLPNLRLLWHTDNKSKHIRSDHTLEELLAKTKGT
jgi:hypothetical protein